jgi:uncharacterized protein
VKLVGLLLLVAMACGAAGAQAAPLAITGATISPSRPIPKGKAPGMRVKLVSDSVAGKVYAVIFRKGDEALSGLTDFATQYHVGDAHFQAIGAVSGATLGWLDLSQKLIGRFRCGSRRRSYR